MSFLIKPLAGHFLKDLDTISKMDPYLKIKHGDKEQKSSVAHGAGKEPKWNDLLEFKASGNLLYVEAYDEDGASDDVIGKGMFDLGQAYNKPNVAAIIDIPMSDSKGKSSGKVSISI
jgi:hypothetical protein